MPSEKSITKAVLAYLRTLDETWAYKTHGSMYSSLVGVPDILCSHRGRFYAFEIKKPGAYLKPVQKRVIEKINESGGTAGVVRSVDDVKDLLSSGNHNRPD